MLTTCIIFLHLVFDEQKVLENLIPEGKMGMNGTCLMEKTKGIDINGDTQVHMCSHKINENRNTWLSNSVWFSPDVPPSLSR